MAHEELKEEISEYLYDHGISITWLSKRVNLSRSHFHKVLRGTGKAEKTLSPKHLERINEALGTDFRFPEPEETDD